MGEGTQEQGVFVCLWRWEDSFEPRTSISQAPLVEQAGRQMGRFIVIVRFESEDLAVLEVVVGEK
jgi:hypothetical protein